MVEQERAGPAAARNRGAATAQGAYVAFLDDNCTPVPGWLAELGRVLAARPDVAVGARRSMRSPKIRLPPQPARRRLSDRGATLAGAVVSLSPVLELRPLTRPLPRAGRGFDRASLRPVVRTAISAAAGFASARALRGSAQPSCRLMLLSQVARRAASRAGRTPARPTPNKRVDCPARRSAGPLRRQAGTRRVMGTASSLEQPQGARDRRRAGHRGRNINRRGERSEQKLCVERLEAGRHALDGEAL
jgi:hypothetical protein